MGSMRLEWSEAEAQGISPVEFGLMIGTRGMDVHNNIVGIELTEGMMLGGVKHDAADKRSLRRFVPLDQIPDSVIERCRVGSADTTDEMFEQLLSVSDPEQRMMILEALQAMPWPRDFEVVKHL